MHNFLITFESVREWGNERSEAETKDRMCTRSGLNVNADKSKLMVLGEEGGLVS